MVDVLKGPNIFPYTPPNSQYSAIIKTEVEKLMYMKSEDELSSLLNQHVQARQSSPLTGTYLERGQW